MSTPKKSARPECRKCGQPLDAGAGETTDGLCGVCFEETFEAPAWSGRHAYITGPYDD